MQKLGEESKETSENFESRRVGGGGEWSDRGEGAGVIRRPSGGLRDPEGGRWPGRKGVARGRKEGEGRARKG